MPAANAQLLTTCSNYHLSPYDNIGIDALCGYHFTGDQQKYLQCQASGNVQ